ncbi:MAG TPA: ribonuclease P protein component [Candidatus Paceibacterota bacterium]|nr:ribonuclease P protein component [Candidatus Paceibacterota bacterium]HOK00650.1 ribonuclease P protein component [Candidatus Pacearchaeota archaeon]HOL90558.1 ribonuclease P protein component [Candidatus Pacearchaeota archaeon]HOM33353.1 ribonuclease P protein component [Candidatus Paceibacterota bacterium]HPO68135.1 ribonuclease P protein component [Candidatus Pacearchaeota archaeon]
MLPLNNRLKKKKDFEEVFKNGKSYKENSLQLKFLENNLKTSRFGFVVSKKFSKKAVVRNKIKRRLREIIRKNLIYIKKGFDCVIIVLPDLKIKKFEELEEILIKLFKKADLLE